MIHSNSLLKLYAHYYFSLGFNITCIGSSVNDYNFINPIVLKNPNHKWNHFLYTKQEIEEVLNYNWEEATGIGTILGHNDYRCLDIDGIEDFSIIEKILAYLGLESDYEWIIISGSRKGAHIYIKSSPHFYNLFPGQTKSFYPNEEFKDKFKTIELRWKYHVVLPPSIHPSFNRYKFLKNLPVDLPKSVDINCVYNMIDNICDRSLVVKSIDMSGHFSYSKNEELNEINDQSATYEDRYYLIFDTETNGLPKNCKSPEYDLDSWPELIQISWFLFSENGNVSDFQSHYIYRPNIILDKTIKELTKIKEEVLKDYFSTPSILEVLDEFEKAILKANFIIAHNLDFDKNVMVAEYLKNFKKNPLKDVKGICTMKSSIEFCSLPDKKWPTLKELNYKLFNADQEVQHNSFDDTKMVAKCFWELVKRGIIDVN